MFDPLIFSQKWPTDFHLHLWLPTKSSTLSEISSPPSEEHSTASNKTHTKHRTDTMEMPPTSLSHFSSPFIYHVKCASNQSQPHSSKSSVPSSNAPCTTDSYPITSLAKEAGGIPQWTHKEFDVVGFDLSMEQVKLGEDYLKLTVWAATTPKNAFIKQGLVLVVIILHTNKYRATAQNEGSGISPPPHTHTHQKLSLVHITF